MDLPFGILHRPHGPPAPEEMNTEVTRIPWSHPIRCHHEYRESNFEARKSAKSKSKRRTFSPEFKSEAVRLAQSPGQSIAIVAKDLGISEGNLRNWIKQNAVDAGNSPAGALTTAEKQELTALRGEIKELRMEREILRKVKVFFAKQLM